MRGRRRLRIAYSGEISLNSELGILSRRVVLKSLIFLDYSRELQILTHVRVDYRRLSQSGAKFASDIRLTGLPVNLRIFGDADGSSNEHLCWIRLLGSLDGRREKCGTSFERRRRIGAVERRIHSLLRWLVLVHSHYIKFLFAFVPVLNIYQKRIIWASPTPL